MNSIGQQLLDVPFGDMVSNLACAIAESQAKLDQGSIEILRAMGDSIENPVELPTIGGKKIVTSMIGAGFQPTFYQFSETVIEVKMAISISRDTTYETTPSPTNEKSSILRRKPIAISATSVNAKYTNTYNFNQEGSSLIRTTLVPVPPNPFIQTMMELKAQEVQKELEKQIG